MSDQKRAENGEMSVGDDKGMTLGVAEWGVWRQIDENLNEIKCDENLSEIKCDENLIKDYKLR